ncbi:hypothetical protein JHK86_027538 [Glycine max]|nr:hypothetical protein JHK86_027538 [Glycine max]
MKDIILTLEQVVVEVVELVVWTLVMMELVQQEVLMCYSALAPLVHVAMVAEEPEALELAVEYERSTMKIHYGCSGVITTVVPRDRRRRIEECHDRYVGVAIIVTCAECPSEALMASTLMASALCYHCRSSVINVHREEELNENFFKELSHVQEIHANCKVLLRTHHQRAGLELMDMMVVYQEGAYERLCRWVQAECRKLGDTDNPEVSELSKTAVHYLKEKSVLFKYCAEQFPVNFPLNEIGQEQLASISREHDTAALQQYGGVVGLSNLLKTNPEKGIHGDDADLLK